MMASLSMNSRLHPGTHRSVEVTGRTHFRCLTPVTLPSLKRPSLVLHASATGAINDGWKEKALLGTLFGGWYASNIVFNLFNKQALSAFPHPLTLTTLQFGIGSILALGMWATGLVQRPKLTPEVVLPILPLALVHTLGNVLTNVSLGAVAVSFTHTIKAMEPFFSVVLSTLFLGDVPSIPVVLTLLPIVGGVVVASVSEASFNWLGFTTAMGSNLTFQSRNVLSKKLMLKKGGLDNISIFSIITMCSFVLLLPFSLGIEGWKLTPSYLTSMGVADPSLVIQHACIAGLCFHTYQQVSYMILQRVSPVTHSIGNSVKRVAVIVAAVFFFSNPMSFQNAVGTSIALAGVFAYSQVKRMQRIAKEMECIALGDEDSPCVLPEATVEDN